MINFSPSEEVDYFAGQVLSSLASRRDPAVPTKHLSALLAYLKDHPSVVSDDECYQKLLVACHVIEGCLTGREPLVDQIQRLWCDIIESRSAMPNKREPVHYAAATGDVATLKRLADAEVVVNRPDADGFTPLYLAASARQEAAMQTLIDAGAKFDGLNNGYTLLQYAVIRNDIAAIESAIAAGASPYDKGGMSHVSNKSPLYLAAENGRVEAFDALMRGVNRWFIDDEGLEALKIAADNGHEVIVQRLVKAGVNIDKCMRYSQIGRYPMSSLDSRKRKFLKQQDRALYQKVETVQKIVTLAHVLELKGKQVFEDFLVDLEGYKGGPNDFILHFLKSIETMTLNPQESEDIKNLKDILEDASALSLSDGATLARIKAGKPTLIPCSVRGTRLSELDHAVAFLCFEGKYLAKDRKNNGV